MQRIPNKIPAFPSLLLWHEGIDDGMLHPLELYPNSAQV